MLPKQNCLTTQGDFKGVFQGSLRARSGPFQLVCRKNQAHINRFGFVVSLSVSKKAVRRNTLRRRLHEIIQTTLLTHVLGYDCVILTYAGADKLKYQEIEEYINGLLQKVGILK